MAAAATTPTRFDTGLLQSAKSAGQRSQRSAAQQLAHWARLGQELEASGAVSARDINRVLAGQISYDEVGEREQAVVRTEWRESIDEGISGLDLRTAFADQGRTQASEADADGTVRVHDTRRLPSRTA